MPDESSSQVNEVEEVVVIVPEEPAGTSAVSGAGPSSAEAANSAESGSVTEEIIDVILDPLGSSGGPDAPGAVEEVVVVEEVIVDPDATGTGTATDPF